MATQKVMTVAICDECGTINRPDALSCSHCGFSLVDNDEPIIKVYTKLDDLYDIMEGIKTNVDTLENAIAEAYSLLDKAMGTDRRY